ncbi:MAG: LPS assembly lipoprotein LptE [Syntrophobacteraceae bacterium]|jgi:hypothetical protein
MVARNLKGILIISSILFCLVSCGYHFSGEGQGPKPGMRFIAIPVFENKTSEPDAGALFAGALRQEFMRKGTMKVVPVEEAEAVFKGTVKNIEMQAVAHEPVANVVANRVTVESRLVVTLDIRCEEKGTHKVLWADQAFRYFKVYQVEDNPLQPNPITGFENRQAALGFLAREMSERIHDRFLSNF